MKNEVIIINCNCSWTWKYSIALHIKMKNILHVGRQLSEKHVVAEILSHVSCGDGPHLWLEDDNIFNLNDMLY